MNPIKRTRGLFYEEGRFVINIPGMRAGVGMSECFVSLTDCCLFNDQQQQQQQKQQQNTKREVDQTSLYNIESEENENVVNNNGEFMNYYAIRECFVNVVDCQKALVGFCRGEISELNEGSGGFLSVANIQVEVKQEEVSDDENQIIPTEVQIIKPEACGNNNNSLICSNNYEDQGAAKPDTNRNEIFEDNETVLDEFINGIEEGEDSCSTDRVQGTSNPLGSISNELKEIDIGSIKRHFETLEQQGHEIAFRIQLKSNSKFCYNTKTVRKLSSSENCIPGVQTPHQPTILCGEEHFFLFHQSPSQQYLLNKYGSLVYIIEIKTTNVFSMFLICVRTNVHAQVVGTILTSKSDEIKEGLTYLKKISKFWRPEYLMIDPSEPIVCAVGEIFQGTEYFFNPEACVREWENYLKNPLNGITEDSEKLLMDLKSILMTSSIRHYTDQVQTMRNGISCNHTAFREKWLFTSKKWVKIFFPEHLLCLMSENWLQEVQMLYEESLLSSHSEFQMDILKQLTENVVTRRWHSYCYKNKELYAKAQNFIERESVIFGLPFFMLAQCVPIYTDLKNDVVVDQIDHRTFEIKIRSDIVSHIFNLGNQFSYPSCTCVDWKNNAMPCQHMFHVLKEYSLDFQCLSPLYRACTYFDIDFSCMEKTKEDEEVISPDSTISDILRQIKDL